MNTGPPSSIWRVRASLARRQWHAESRGGTTSSHSTAGDAARPRDVRRPLLLCRPPFFEGRLCRRLRDGGRYEDADFPSDAADVRSEAWLYGDGRVATRRAECVIIHCRWISTISSSSGGFLGSRRSRT